MARAPFQILVYPYRKVNGNECEYALLQRSDTGWWQGIAGGGEGDETPLEADEKIILSPEHSEYRWLKYGEADALMKYEGNRTALWEFDQRLKCNEPNR
jgi:8-oxo-dGTP pyrophosphatase MutT (NUDIX family)